MNYEFNKENFDHIMEEFVKLDSKTKRDKIIEDLKFLIAYQSKLCSVNNTDFSLIFNKEMADLNQDNVSEKDFLEALYAYVYILKSANLQFINSVSKSLTELGTMLQQGSDY